MDRSNNSTLSRQLLFRVLDPILMLGVLLLAWRAREERFPQVDDWPAIMLAVIIAMMALHICGAYRALADYRVSVWIRRSLTGLTMVLIAILAAAYVLKQSSTLSRSVLGSWYIGSCGLLICFRVLAHRIVVRQYAKGLWVEAVVLVGEPRLALSFSRHLKRHPALGLRPVAIVSEQAEQIAGATQTISVNGNLDDLAPLVDQHRASRVLVCGGLGDQQLLLDVTRRLAGRTVTIQYAPDSSLVPIFSMHTDDCAGRTLIDLSRSPWDDRVWAIKWIEDKVLAIVILVLSSPLLLLIAIGIKWSSPGPVIFSQERHGLGGRPFRIYKFRTMRPDIPVGKEEERVVPEQVVQAQMKIDEDSDIFAPLSEEATFIQAVPGDPRVTPLGRILRQTSLDEFPQFWNVVCGDMSIVGPRPHALAHNLRYVASIAELMARHHAKPGITGLAQISGARGQTANTQAMRDRLRFDLDYIRDWSLWLDLKIIVLTAVRGFYNREP